MANRYNAFISYRHAPLDSRVAKAIQHDLEHFHIPGSLRRRFGMKRINRIFRDKEELPITSNLNEDIAEALASSDFLIVICSPRTRESHWVEKEIETFLKTHTRHQVLTVLAEGEPGDVIPEILRSETVTDPVTGEKRQVLVEPLSCDYRLPKGKARREELPRLAAALIGCKYDDLRQRQRLYRARQLAAVLGSALVLALAFTGYALDAGMRIRENYEQALKNQSKYLAAESTRSRLGGDRLTAIALALEALPGEGRERPLLADAELALAESLRAYSDGSSMTDVGAYTPEHPVRTFFVSGQGKYLCTQDWEYVLDFWDVETYQKLWSVQTSPGVDEFYFLDEQRFLLIDTEGGLTCRSAENGDEIWRLFLGESEPFSGFLCNVQGNVLLADCMGELYRIALDSGRVLWKIPRESFQKNGEERTGPFYLGEDSISPDGALAVLKTTSGNFLDPQDDLIYVDLEKGTLCYSEQTFPTLLDACFTQDGNVALLALPEPFGERGVFYREFTQSVSEETVHTVVCMDPGTDQQLWQNTQLVYNQGNEDFLQCCEDGNLFLGTAELCARIDARTGGSLGQCRMPASILRAYQDGNSARLVLEDGSAGFFRYDCFLGEAVKFFVDRLGEGHITPTGEGTAQYFVSQRGGASVIRYKNGTDSYYTDFSGQVPEQSYSGGLYDGGHVLVQAGWERDLLYLLDLENHQIRLAADLTEQEVRGRTPLHFSMDAGQYVFCFNGEVMCLDLNTGDLTGYARPAPEGAYPDFRMLYRDETVWYLASRYLDMEQCAVYLCRYDWRTGEMESKQWTLPYGSYDLRQVGPQWIIYDRDTSGAWWPSWEDGSLTVLAVPVTKETPLAWNEEKKMLAVAGEGGISLVRPDGTAAGFLETNAKLLSLDFSGEILAVDDSLQLLHFSAEGEQPGTVALYGSQSVEPDRIRWDHAQDGSVFLYVGTDLNIVRLEENALCTHVSHCLYYDSALDQFLCWDRTPVTFDRFTVEQLVQMGREALGSFRLADPARYGIE